MAVALEMTCERCGKKEKAVSERLHHGGELLHFFEGGTKIHDVRPKQGNSIESDFCAGCTKLYEFFVASGTPEGRKKIGVPPHFEALMGLLQRIDRAAGGTGGEIGGDLRSALVGLLRSSGGDPAESGSPK
jgi:hypothetical protein